MTQGPTGGESSRAPLVGSAALFAVSSVFPGAASVLSVDRLPTWVGVVDVVLAVALVILGMLLVSRKPGEFAAPVVATSFRIYRGLASTLPILLLLFLVAGESIKWNILLPGLAWRGWLLVMALPSWLSLWHTGRQGCEG